MTLLFDNARRLLDAAAHASAAAPRDAQDWTVFYGPDGGLQMIAGPPPSLESLAHTHGARTAWQVSRRSGRIRVDGLSPSERCLLESEAPPARRLLNDTPLYLLEPR